MKIQCDVCDQAEASVFCTADEAALCSACDRRVHHANKLAGQHQRFSLVHSHAPKHAPVCDICQERKAFLFCQQDRAILCRECDGAIHQVNDHTRKHNRFLLAGVKLSPNSTLYSSSESASSGFTNTNSYTQKSSNNNDPVSAVCTPSTAKGTTDESTAALTPCEKSFHYVQSMNGGNSFSGSFQIPEALMEMLPGCHFDDFPDSSSFFKNGDNELLPLWDGDWESNTGYMSSYFPTGKMGIWVPQQNQSGFGLGEQSLKELTTNSSSKSTRKMDQDNFFTVPQIIP